MKAENRPPEGERLLNACCGGVVKWLPALGGQLFPGRGLSTLHPKMFRLSSRQAQSAGPDVHRFDGLVDHTLRFQRRRSNSFYHISKLYFQPQLAFLSSVAVMSAPMQSTGEQPGNDGYGTSENGEQPQHGLFPA